jgi:dienelactone hydrolase
VRPSGPCEPVATALALDWLEGQPEIDSSRIAVRGVSMGSMWATQAAAGNSDRIKVCRGLPAPGTGLPYLAIGGEDDELTAMEIVLGDHLPEVLLGE